MKKIITLLFILNFNMSTLYSEPITEINSSNQDFLKLGKNNEHVKELQEFLNINGFNSTDSGPGSPRNETTIFDKVTSESIKIFQEFSKIAETGEIDELTIIEINNYISRNEEEIEELGGDEGKKDTNAENESAKVSSSESIIKYDLLGTEVSKKFENEKLEDDHINEIPENKESEKTFLGTFLRNFFEINRSNGIGGFYKLFFND